MRKYGRAWLETQTEPGTHGNNIVVLAFAYGFFTKTVSTRMIDGSPDYVGVYRYQLVEAKYQSGTEIKAFARMLHMTGRCIIIECVVSSADQQVYLVPVAWLWMENLQVHTESGKINVSVP